MIWTFILPELSYEQEEQPIAQFIYTARELSESIEASGGLTSLPASASPPWQGKVLSQLPTPSVLLEMEHATEAQILDVEQPFTPQGKPQGYIFTSQ